ncbi:hypothetical protein C8R45DRAFT_345398 [Mycena sanguinolenta]|nr:hypothetical protein C8R45DRAFT_345398 [Mycena sanguinolenta]
MLADLFLHLIFLYLTSLLAATLILQTDCGELVTQSISLPSSWPFFKQSEGHREFHCNRECVQTPWTAHIFCDFRQPCFMSFNSPTEAHSASLHIEIHPYGPMASSGGSDDTLHSPTNHSFPPPAMPVYMYPLYSTSQTVRSKRTQVKIACTKCKKSCKKCDPARPCLRCVKYGFAAECVDSKRKVREKGLKRGPYKKRNGNHIVDSEDHSQGTELGASPSTSGTSRSTTPAGYNPGLYAQWPLFQDDGLNVPA